MENGPLKMYFLLKMGIIHCYVSLPNGTQPQLVNLPDFWLPSTVDTMPALGIQAEAPALVVHIPVVVVLGNPRWGMPRWK